MYRCRYIVVMERLSGAQDLFDYITEKRRLDEREARVLMSQVIDTVIQLHEAGVVHRDIKDENIVIDVDTKQLRLVDFGSATLVRRRPFTDFDGTTSLAAQFSLHRKQDFRVEILGRKKI